MLRHTRNIQELYEDIQRRIFKMIPEKWDSLYLYASVMEGQKETGEMFFYYIPKGIFKKKPVNVYEIPSKFNIDESEYLKLVDNLYAKIKDLRQEFKKLELGETWSNVTIIIHNARFMVEYDYEDLKDNPLSSYERHVIWRCKYLGISFEQLNKEEKDILRKYASGPKILARVERYEAGIYIKDLNNVITYDTQGKTDVNNEEANEQEYVKKDKSIRNQILSKVEIEDDKKNIKQLLIGCIPNKY